MDKTIKIVAAVFAIIIFGCVVLLWGTPGAQPLPGPVSGNPGTPGSSNLTVTYFYGAECSHCAKVKPTINALIQKYPQVTFNEYEVWHNQTNQSMMDKVNGQLGLSGAGVPEVIIGTTVLIGDQDIPAKLEGLIQAALKKNQ